MLTTCFFKIRFLFLFVVCGLLTENAVGQKRVQCPDGEHLEINLKQISIEYDAKSFAGTLSSLNALGIRMEIDSKKLQEAAAATQQWDVFLKGLAEGYNKCAVTKLQYAEGLKHIYPRLKEDATDLEEIRKAITDGRNNEIKRVQALLDSFYSNLHRFAQIGNQEIVIERIEALSEEINSTHSQILQRQQTDTELILAKLNELETRNAQTPVSTPKEVGKQLTEIRLRLIGRTDEAESAYKKGFELYEKYHFKEAVPYFQKALDAVPLPEFYLSLGRAYLEIPNISKAVAILRDGFKAAEEQHDNKREAQIAGQLGIALQNQGNLDEALTYMRLAYLIDQKLYRSDSQETASDENNIGQVFQAKGDLQGALNHTQRALEIDEKIYGLDHPDIAAELHNVGAILLDLGDIRGALKFAERALRITEKAYGSDDYRVGVIANNISRIYKTKGDLDAALTYAQRTLTAMEKIYGPDHPNVATAENNIAQLLKEQGDPYRAFNHAQRSLKIDALAYGENDPEVAVDSRTLAGILNAQGDFDSALTYGKRALEIDKAVFGEKDHRVATDYNFIGLTFQGKKDLDNALLYSQRALKVDEDASGSQDPEVGMDWHNIGAILRDKGDLEGALLAGKRALDIVEAAYGPDHYKIALVAVSLGLSMKRLGDLNGALLNTRRALDILTKLYGPDNLLAKRVALQLDEIERLLKSDQY